MRPSGVCSRTEMANWPLRLDQSNSLRTNQLLTFTTNSLRTNQLLSFTTMMSCISSWSQMLVRDEVQNMYFRRILERRLRAWSYERSYLRSLDKANVDRWSNRWQISEPFTSRTSFFQTNTDSNHRYWVTKSYVTLSLRPSWLDGTEDRRSNTIVSTPTSHR